MGFLNFLNKRFADDGKSERSFRFKNGRSVLIGSETSLRSSYVPSISDSMAASLSRPQAHVDILDAQGGIRPHDFRSRVQAAGVRDYGEDVAERNMGENGVDVRSAAAREFYARKSSISSQSPSMARRESAQPSYRGSRSNIRGDMSVTENWTPTRPSSGLSLEPRQASRQGVRSLQRPVVSPSSPAARPGSSASTDRQSGTTRSGISRNTHNVNSTRISIGPPVSGASPSHARQSRRPSKLRDRSISPPCVPRYRSQSSLSVRREQSYSHDQRGENECRRAASATGMSSLSGYVRPHLSSEDLHPHLDRLHPVDNEADLDSGASRAVPVHAAKSQLGGAAPPFHHPELHDAVRRAVDESLAQLPLSVDWKALLEMAQKGLALDGELGPQKVPQRRSSLHPGSLPLSNSTPTTAEFSDYGSRSGSSVAGYPSSSRHTKATSIDSLASPKSLSVHPTMFDGRSSVGDGYQISPTFSTLDEDHRVGPIPEVCYSDDARYHSGIMNIEHAECLTSDYSDVDSFTEKRQSRFNDTEGSLFHDAGLRDLSANLPGLVTDTTPSPCLVCRVLSNLHGDDTAVGSAPSTPCDHHSGGMSRKQRLKALGYDYESDDESDMLPAKPAKGGRTKRLTSGTGGGLRRLKLVDDRIEEASEEDRAGSLDSERRRDLRRRPKFGGLGRAPLRCTVGGREDGNVADMERKDVIVARTH
ncbi:hypothetical protein E4U32_005772 [Claviceps aff. humidiphila group G2b]|nr:hypothetical protein E4U32_005772 [Claviceps aff. humidiphila group G2b]